ncbi:MAG: SUMF1/EgtB/PvdO family nonheme iron enzyme, partial [Pseudomonadota bacterium]
YHCNIWQGRFPARNTGADGYTGPCPADGFAPNGYGLYGMAGNVWDWTADTFRLRSLSKAAKAHGAAMAGYKVIKGGSYLCHASYCTRYRIAARTGNSSDSSTDHTGFRVAFDKT